MFPRLLADGIMNEKKLKYVVIPKYDIDLEHLFVARKRKFQLSTIINMGLQIIERLEVMHNCGLFHNDMKPQNLMSNLDCNNIILIDFGLTINFHAPQKGKYVFKGTPFFASNNALMRGVPGAKDDLESIIYILIYFYHGKLPWTKNVPVLNEEVEA